MMIPYRILRVCRVVPALAVCVFYHGASAATFRVADAEGAPLDGIEVRVTLADDWGRARGEVLATTFSGPDGLFSVSLPEGDRAFLVLVGDQGKGTVKADRGGAGNVLTYPVETEVILLHDNDQHFNYNHEEAFLAVLESFRRENENVFLLNGGDIFTRHPHRWNPVGSLRFYFERTRWLVEAMNRAKYDVMVLGNHEIHYHGYLTGAALEIAEFPILGANVRVLEGYIPQPDPYVIFATRNGLGLAFVGLATGVAEGIELDRPLETLKRYTDLADENALFAALTHIGFGNDRRLAEADTPLQLIVGGHSHTLLPEPQWHHGVAVVQAGGFPHVDGGRLFPDDPRALGVVRLRFVNEELVELQGELISIDSTGARPALRALGAAGPGNRIE